VTNGRTLLDQRRRAGVQEQRRPGQSRDRDHTGTCPITSNPYISTIYGALMGYLLSGGVR
jgi:hypothetical protein